jgi:hypothetical protein
MSDKRVAAQSGSTAGSNHEPVDILRRSLLNCVAGGVAAGALPVTGGLAADSGRSATQPTDSDARTWMSDEVPGKPLHDICLPGTHHAAMHGCGANYWWHTQDATVRTQLEDGIRYLDIRPGVYYDKTTLLNSGVADQMSAEWTALIEEAGSVANLIPNIGNIDDTLVGVIDTLVSFEDPDWVAEKYVQSCADSGTGGELPLDALLLRVLASLFGEFDIPDYGLDLDTVRLDRAANVDLERDGFREHHGGDLARPYDWGAPLEESFGELRSYLDAVDSEGASEIVILQVKQFWDLLEIDLTAADWQAFADLLDATLGEYILDLSAYDPDAFAALSPADLDGPRVAVLVGGPDASVWEPPAWAGDLGYITDHFPSETEPGDVLEYAVTHTERRTHDSTGLDRVEFQVTPDTDTVVDVTIETVDIRSEYDSRLLYANLLQAAERTNAVLDGYIDTVRRNPDQNPNIISIDFYDRSNLVSLCRALSREGVIDGGNPVETPALPAGDYRLTSMETNRAVAVDGGLTTAQRATDETQRFRLVPEDIGRYRIEHAQSGDVLTVAGEANGDSIGLSAWQDSPDQRWFVAELADGTYALVNQHSGRALDSTSDYEGYADGRVVQWHLHAQTNQRWLLEPLAAEPPAVGDAPPQDRDGDGLYERVRGDREFAIDDVQALFENLDSPAVQDHADRYNFYGNDPTEVTILDVQGLFNRFSES